MRRAALLTLAAAMTAPAAGPEPMPCMATGPDSGWARRMGEPSAPSTRPPRAASAARSAEGRHASDGSRQASTAEGWAGNRPPGSAQRAEPSGGLTAAKGAGAAAVHRGVGAPSVHTEVCGSSSGEQQHTFRRGQTWHAPPAVGRGAHTRLARSGGSPEGQPRAAAWRAWKHSPTRDGHVGAGQRHLFLICLAHQQLVVRPGREGTKEAAPVARPGASPGCKET